MSSSTISTRRKEAMNGSHQTTFKTRSSSSSAFNYDSLPRTRKGMDEMDGSVMGDVPEAAYRRSQSVSSVEAVQQQQARGGNKIMMDEARKTSLKQLNERLVSYIDKVRLLQQATDVFDSMNRSESDSTSVKAITVQFENELADWKLKYEAMLSDLNKIKIENNNVKEENRHLNGRLEEQETMLRDRDSTLANLETEIAQLISKLNLLQNEKGRLDENGQLLRNDLEKYKSDLSGLKKGYDKEKHKNAELEAKLRSIEQEVAFKLQVLENQLIEERKKGQIDISVIDQKLKERYESRLQKELKKLREMYEEQTEKAKREYMTVHARELVSMQEELSTERSRNGAAVTELKDVLENLEELKARIGELEGERMSLSASVGQLSQSLKEQGAAFRAQLMAKDRELVILRDKIARDREEYDKLLQVNNELDLEIEIYRNVIDSEIKRFRKMSTVKGKSSGKVEGDDSSGSSSDEEKRTTAYSTAKDTVDGRVYRTQKSSTTTYSSKQMARSKF